MLCEKNSLRWGLHAIHLWIYWSHRNETLKGLNMNSQALATVAAKIAESAVQFLAAKHGVSEDHVMHHLANGHEHLTEQYESLILAGINKAADMVKAGDIEVTA